AVLHGPGVHPAVAVDVGHPVVGRTVEVLVVLSALQQTVAVAVVADEVDPAVVVAVLVDVDTAVRVPDRRVLVPLPVAAGVDVRVVADRRLVPGPRCQPALGALDRAVVRRRIRPVLDRAEVPAVFDRTEMPAADVARPDPGRLALRYLTQSGV